MNNTLYIGAKCVPSFYIGSGGSSDWASGVPYEPLTVVTYNGSWYISKIAVPASTTAPAAGTYWAKVPGYLTELDTSFIEWAQEHIGDLETDVSGLDTRLNAAEGDITELKDDLSDIIDHQIIIKFDDTVTGNTMQEVSVNIPAGIYKLTVANISTSDTDKTYNRVMFYDADNGTAASCDLNRGLAINTTITFASKAVKAVFYAASDWASSNGDTFTYTDFKIWKDTPLNERLSIGESVAADLKSTIVRIEDFTENSALTNITSDFALQSGYIDKNNGNFIAYQYAESTGFLDIYIYADLYVSGEAPHPSNCLYAVYNSSHTFLGAYKNNTVETDYHFRLSDILALYPSAKYVRFSDITANSRHLIIKRMANMSDLVLRSLPWAGKKWVCIGDSLTEVNTRTTKHYYEYVQDLTGINVVNMGLSGSGYGAKNDIDGAFYQRILNTPTDADVITIFGSFNDTFTEIPLGTSADGGTSTLGGCMNTTLTNLFNIIPLANLGIVSPPPWANRTPSTADAVSYVELIEDVCKKWSIPYLDLFHSSQLRPWDSTFRQYAYTRDEGAGTHPDENGHKLLAPRFKGFLDTILL